MGSSRGNKITNMKLEEILIHKVVMGAATALTMIELTKQPATPGEQD